MPYAAITAQMAGLLPLTAISGLTVQYSRAMLPVYKERRRTRRPKSKTRRYPYGYGTSPI